MGELGSELLTIIQWLKSLAPHLWRMMRRQVMAEGLTNMVWAIVLWSGVGLCVWGARRLWEKKQDDHGPYYDDGGLGWRIAGLVLAGGVLFLIGVGDFLYAVRVWYNPDYYAIKLLLSLVGG